MCSVEWHRRGLLHVHILVWLVDTIRQDQVDLIISAEIPDPDIDPDFHHLVTCRLNTCPTRCCKLGMRLCTESVVRGAISSSLLQRVAVIQRPAEYSLSRYCRVAGLVLHLYVGQSIQSRALCKERVAGARAIITWGEKHDKRPSC